MVDKKYNALDFVLHEITSERIKISKEERKAYKEHFNDVLEKLVTKLKEDKVFKFLYQRNFYAGSSYENLKISKPDEFDINLLFSWPPNVCEVSSDAHHPGYVKLKINRDDCLLPTKQKNVPELQKKLNKWIRETEFFDRNKFRSWMQGIVQKALKQLNIENAEIRQSVSGPAITLKVTEAKRRLYYSVDLVPAFVFTKKDWPSPPARQFPDGIDCQEWMVVPKEPLKEECSVYWKNSFFQQEKALLNDKKVVKHVIKLMKLLRDEENWNGLYSYAIKSLFLWECENSNDLSRKGLGYMLIYMLQKLSEYLDNGIIPFYWDKNLNLLEKMKKETMKNMSDRIKAILKSIEINLHDHSQIKKYFGSESHNTRITSEKSEPSFQNVIDLNSPIIEESSSSSFSTNTETEALKESFANMKCSQISSLCEHHFEMLRDPVENKIDVDRLPKNTPCCTNQYRNGLQKNTVCDKNCIPIANIFSAILKEQQEIKQCLLPLAETIRILSEEMKELRQKIDNLSDNHKHKCSHNSITK